MRLIQVSLLVAGLVACMPSLRVDCGALDEVRCRAVTEQVVYVVQRHNPGRYVVSITFSDLGHARVILDDDTEIGWGERLSVHRGALGRVPQATLQYEVQQVTDGLSWYNAVLLVDALHPDEPEVTDLLTERSVIVGQATNDEQALVKAASRWWPVLRRAGRG